MVSDVVVLGGTCKNITVFCAILGGQELTATIAEIIRKEIFIIY
jgi:hypothetical protein